MQAKSEAGTRECRAAEIAGSIKAAHAAPGAQVLWRSPAREDGALDRASFAGMISPEKAWVTASRNLHSSVIEQMRSTRYRRD
jgi:hypothetical protein